MTTYFRKLCSRHLALVAETAIPHGLLKDVLHMYLDHGDSVLLAKLIHIVERLTPTPHDSDSDGTHNHMLNLPVDGLIRHTLRIAGKFQVAGTCRNFEISSAPRLTECLS